MHLVKPAVCVSWPLSHEIGMNDLELLLPGSQASLQATAMICGALWSSVEFKQVFVVPWGGSLHVSAARSIFALHIINNMPTSSTLPTVRIAI